VELLESRLVLSSTDGLTAVTTVVVQPPAVTTVVVQPPAVTTPAVTVQWVPDSATTTWSLYP
jgi:hypothetical protein